MNIDLAYVRNGLLNNTYDPKMKDIINDTISSLEVDNPFSDIIQQALENALVDIERKKYIDAGYQVNLIHNMPQIKKDIVKWDEDHFYNFEIPLFFENVEGTNRIKKMILLLSTLQSDV